MIDMAHLRGLRYLSISTLVIQGVGLGFSDKSVSPGHMRPWVQTPAQKKIIN
jgi:hypothetical protein